MPIVQMLDGAMVEMPDQLTPEMGKRLRALQSAQQVPQEKIAPHTGNVIINAANKGLAAIPDALLNTPANIINLAKMTAGIPMAAIGRPDLAPDITQAPNYANKLMQSMGFIRPEYEPQTEGQRYLDVGVQGLAGGSVMPAQSVGRVASNALLGALGSTAGHAVGEATGSTAAGIAASLLAPAGAVPAARTAGRMAGGAASNILGLTTGTGAKNIEDAISSGYNKKTAFLENISGQVPKTEVLEQAKQALQNMRFDRSADYRKNIATTEADATPLNFSPIDKALADVKASMQYKGHSKIGEAEVSRINEAEAIVNEWRNDPSMHTAMGLDALKQRLDAAMPQTAEMNQAQRAISNIRNSVKDTIVKQSPEYAKTMQAYEEGIKLEQEISRALSLGKTASADTALRKLQSLSRNNANANYGYRADLARELELQGGADLMPAIAGQAMSSWTPRSLSGQGAGLATLGAIAAGNPAIAAALPLQSPRVVGTAAYGAGRAAGTIGRPLSEWYARSGMNLTPDQANYMNTLLQQSGQQNQNSLRR